MATMEYDSDLERFRSVAMYAQYAQGVGTLSTTAATTGNFQISSNNVGWNEPSTRPGEALPEPKKHVDNYYDELRNEIDDWLQIAA